MSAKISKQDEALLGYMTDLKVEEVRFPRDCRKILLFFRKNPYVQNEVVVKEYVLSAAGYGLSHSTPIQWHQNYEREAYRRRHHNTSPNFFNWFSDHSFAGSSRIAEIILDDLWPNPLQYYVRKKAPGGGTDRRTGEGAQGVGAEMCTVGPRGTWAAPLETLRLRGTLRGRDPGSKGHHRDTGSPDKCSAKRVLPGEA